MKLLFFVDRDENVFTFNSEYRLEKDREKYQLSKNKNYVHNFYYKGRSKPIEISSIIGRNNSGKTTLLKKVFNYEGTFIYLTNRNEEKQTQEDEILIVYNSENNNLEIDTALKVTNSKKIPSVPIFLSNSIEPNFELKNELIPNFGKGVNLQKVETNLSLMNSTSYLKDIVNDNVLKQIEFVLHSFKSESLLEEFMDVPNKVEFKLNHGDVNYDELIHTFFHEDKEVFELLYSRINENNLREILIHNSIVDFLIETLEVSNLYEWKQMVLTIINPYFKNTFSSIEGYSHLLESDEKFDLSYSNNIDSDHLKEKFSDELAKLSNSLEILNYLPNLENNIFHIEDVAIFFKKLKVGQSTHNENTKPNYIKLPSMRWLDISSGQFYLLNLFSEINTLKIQVNGRKGIEHYLFIIDEIDLGLHPEWQRKWIEYVPRIISDMFPSESIQFIITTHSPIILSDLRNDNIIYMNKWKQIKDESLTFGSSINTLMARSFFLNGGTMGEFSKNYINWMFKELNEDIINSKKLKEIQMLSNEVGEEVLQDNLKSIIIGKKENSLSKNEQIEFYENKLRELKRNL